MKYAEFRVEGLFEEDYTMRVKYKEIVCKFCGSPNIVKNGTRNGVQYWLCKNCGRGFVDNKGLPGMRYSIDDVASAIYQYYTGSSLNEIRGYIDQHSGFRPSDSTIYSWITRFTKIAMDKAKEYTPQVGDVWVADETVLHIGGKRIDRLKKGMWFWDIIDAKTRFLLASHISRSRTINDAIALMEKAWERTDKVPKVVITDKLQAYLDGVSTVFGRTTTKHIQSHGFAVKLNTNLIERFHGTLKDRTEVMRGMKTVRTARLILDGWLIYYNFFRPHESLKDKTPAEVAGIEFPFKNWLDVVKSQSPLEQKAKEPIRVPSSHDILFPPPKPYRKRRPVRKLGKTRKTSITTEGIKLIEE